jgi:hypothetical protein
MSFGEEGWKNRLEVLKDLGKSIDGNGFPVSDYPDIWAEIPNMVELPGTVAALEILSDAVPDFNKWVPGWAEYHAWAAEQAIFESLNSGEVSAADKAKEMEDKANQLVQEAFSNLE